MNILDLISITIITIILAIGLIAIDKQEGSNPFLRAYNLAITIPIRCGACIGIAVGCAICAKYHPSLIPFLLSLTK